MGPMLFFRARGVYCLKLPGPHGNFYWARNVSQLVRLNAYEQHLPQLLRVGSKHKSARPDNAHTENGKHIAGLLCSPGTKLFRTFLGR